MKSRFAIAVLGSILAVSSAVAFQAEAQAQYRSQNYQSSRVTVFQCVRYGKAFATVAQRGDRRSAPMIVWESYAFGSEYTPKQRCNTVSGKLTRAVAQNGGKMTNLLLTTGIVKGQTVICYINTGEVGCNPSNTLFSLKPENAKNPGAALAGLLRFGRSGSGTALHESAEDEDVAINMEAAVEQALAAGDESPGGGENSSYGSASDSQSNPEVNDNYAPNP